jgi:NAD(P)-dependent dehydrogenase (short-subunit alcohol dehydrogenase family)
MASDRAVALVTGASGIAASTIRLLAGRGLAVATVDREAQTVEGLAQSVEGLFGTVRDLTEPDAADDVVNRVVERFGRLDVLVNVVGISGRRFGDGPVHECTDDGWNTVLDVNLTTTFRMCRAALVEMTRVGRGSIVNTASVLGYAPNKLFATHAYAASKGGIIALTRAMASYYADQGIRVNAVAPGLIATPMSQRAQGDEATIAYIRERQPLTGTFGAADDVAEAIAFLALEQSRFVTGTVLEVAGGWGVA